LPFCPRFAVFTITGISIKGRATEMAKRKKIHVLLVAVWRWGRDGAIFFYLRTFCVMAHEK